MATKKQLQEIGRRAKNAAESVANATDNIKNRALHSAATSIRDHQSDILQENRNDMENGAKNGLSSAMLDRLKLNGNRVQAMADSLVEVSKLPDPIGKITEDWTQPNGLNISRVRVPIGVIGIIYESRPNVTADAAGLCIKSGNSVILRGGSESHRSSMVIYSSLLDGLKDAKLPDDTVQIIQTTNRAAVGHMLKMNDYIDIIIPRGGKSLVERIQREARVPILAHLEGICHTYVHQRANRSMAREVVTNAKMRRPGICGATETLLIDREAVKTHLPLILDDLIDSGCQVRGDRKIAATDRRILPASENDWNTEYLDSIISIKEVNSVDDAISHINKYGSEHTDAIITEDFEVASLFLRKVNSAIVLHNSSTQFADGGEFGMGAEIGIATGKLHARGPVGVEQLTTYKYIVRGTGQIRP